MNQQQSKAVSPVSAGSLWAALAGAGGGLLSFPGGEIVGSFSDANGGAPTNDIIGLIVGAALWSGAIGLTIGAAILITDNLRSLRGQWHRDLWLALPLFFALSFGGGVAGQISYLFVQNSLTRGIGWALIGTAIGVGLGFVRRDMLQAARGAMGGALGGFIGGFIFDGLTALNDAGDGSLSRFVGQIIMGALIALFMRVVQDALKSAWLLGISTGPYEGKEYPLNTARVSVGRDDSNAIALFREESLPRTLGALTFQNQQWFWQGEAIQVNGVALENAPLNAGDTLQIGATKFRFLARSAKTGTPTYQPPPVVPMPAAYVPPPASASASASASALDSVEAASAPTVASWPMPTAATAPDSVSAGASASAPTVRATIRAKMPAFALISLQGQRIAVPACEQAITIGRGANNAIVVADAGVSSSHARLQWRNGALEFTDLGSTNGSFVNGEKLAPNVARQIKVGDRLRLGKLDFTLRLNVP